MLEWANQSSSFVIYSVVLIENTFRKRSWKCRNFHWWHRLQLENEDCKFYKIEQMQTIFSFPLTVCDHVTSLHWAMSADQILQCRPELQYSAVPHGGSVAPPNTYRCSVCLLTVQHPPQPVTSDANYERMDGWINDDVPLNQFDEETFLR